jgi:hypothetical protein
MTKGIIARNTPAHLSPKDLAECTILFVEAEAFTRGSPGGSRGMECLPMISAFLGAKAWPTKLSELEYVKTAGAQRVLFFPDLRNIKYGSFPAFCTEIESIERETAEIGCIVYVAVDCLTPGELAEAASLLAERRLTVMLGFGGGDEGRVLSAPDIVSGVIARIPAARIWCAFWDAAELRKSMDGLERLGIQRVVALA